jgi:alkaline phosphatase D
MRIKNSRQAAAGSVLLFAAIGIMAAAGGTAAARSSAAALPPAGHGDAAAFRSAWPTGVERIWPGPEYWTNRLQDWQIRGGRLECLLPAADRNVHLLTRTIAPGSGTLLSSVRTGVVIPFEGARGRNWVGFRIGAKGDFPDPRNAVIYGKGLEAGLSTEGDLFIGDFELLQRGGVQRSLRDSLKAGVELRFEARPAGAKAALTLTATDPASRAVLASVEQDEVDPAFLEGNIALVSHLPELGRPEDGPVSWFDDWTVEGSRVQSGDGNAFGPILFAQYTVSRGILNLTAQLPPVGASDGRTVNLLARKADGTWMSVADAPIDPDARTAGFRVPGWDTSRDVSYRLVYELASGAGTRTPYAYEGTVRREPLAKRRITLAALCCQNDIGFPHSEIAAHVGSFDPDLLFFAGDQIYERVAGYGTQVEPVEDAILDYLRKWYLFGWAFGGILRDHPAITIPDDHDVYHGNLWGEGGKAASPGPSMDAQDSGGYKMPARWVNMVQRTQTSHLPEAADPAPAGQGIGVYFCEVRYAGLSLAVVEDRKFKSAPKALLPGAEIRNGWAQNPDWQAAKESDVKGAELLGERQMKFLRAWAADWSGGTWMKAVLSQTLWSTLATLPAGTTNDDGVPGLPVCKPGEYPPDDVPMADLDSDGWPPAARGAAIREMRKAFALHICGDQHLGSTIRYGVDAWGDAGYALCVPAISNLWPRRWFPKTAGLNRKPGDPRYAGDYRDAFGNRMTVLAAANPQVTGLRPAELYDRSTGYGIVVFDRETRDISLACWPRQTDPSQPGARPYSGWPVTLNQLDNYGRAAKAWLPTLTFKGLTDPVVQVVDERNGEIVYTVRARGGSFRPKVFAAGAYTVRVGEPGTERWKSLRRVMTLPPGGKGQRIVEF